MIVIDTDIFVDLTRNFPPAKDFFLELGDEAAISAITETELLAGLEAETQQGLDRLFHFLLKFNKIDVGNPIAYTAATFRRKYKLEVPDAIIAATAFHSKAPLFTRNIKDFGKVMEISVRSPY